MKGQLKRIFQPFKNDLKEFDRHFKRLMSSNVRIVDAIAKYLVIHKGKQFRPALLLVSARASGEPQQATYVTAVVVELLHTATLIHDDVVDNAELRRGFPTIHKIWKSKVAILMGDYLLAKSLIAATETQNLEIMNIIATVAKRMSKGELLQFQKSRNLDITEREYFQLIADKTASLISACCELGAVTVDAPPDYRERLKDYGEYLGMAFQIKDDMLDYEGSIGVLGKPVGLDLKEKKITLPLLYAFRESPGKSRKRIIRTLKNGADKKDILEIVRFVNEYGGLEKAHLKAVEFKDRALETLEGLPRSPARDALATLAEFAITRNK
ncbi:MAG: polyprenyl synthetase family protein [Calditrichaeota bacterium]|nr:polyprenyl synthetase family protein [Calditrichota bacterium]